MTQTFGMLSLTHCLRGRHDPPRLLHGLSGVRSLHSNHASIQQRRVEKTPFRHRFQKFLHRGLVPAFVVSRPFPSEISSSFQLDSSFDDLSALFLALTALLLAFLRQLIEEGLDWRKGSTRS